MKDIVERLRDHDRHVRGRLIEGLPDLCIDDMIEAADEIERLREALLKIQKRAEQQSTMPFDRHADYFRMARAALGEGTE